MIEEKLENSQDLKGSISELIGKLKNAGTIKEIKKVSAELGDYVEKLKISQEKEKIEREEKIAGLTATLMQTYHYLDRYSYKISGEKLPKTLYDLIDKHLEMAKEFDYLSTIKVLARELEFYHKFGIDEGGKENDKQYRRDT